MKRETIREVVKRGAYDRLYVQDCLVITDYRYGIAIKDSVRVTVSGCVLAINVRRYTFADKCGLLLSCFRWIFLRPADAGADHV